MHPFIKQRLFDSSKTRKQMAAEYNMGVVTFWRKLNKEKIEIPSGLITRKWQQVIYERFGYPRGLSKRDFE